MGELVSDRTRLLLKGEGVKNLRLEPRCPSGKEQYHDLAFEADGRTHYVELKAQRGKEASGQWPTAKMKGKISRPPEIPHSAQWYGVAVVHSKKAKAEIAGMAALPGSRSLASSKERIGVLVYADPWNESFRAEIVAAAD